VPIGGSGDLCVNPGGTAGCFSSINAAIAAASPNDTVKVAVGTGAGSGTTATDAAGLANGVYIDGIDNPGLAIVVVGGFQVQNAKFEGILVADASRITIVGNRVFNNNKSLIVSPLLSGPAVFRNQ
jgi:hypothetical protein